jgi:xanthine dehydrogenase accessory factor
MGCASEGAIEVYIEPHVPRRELLVVGFTPVAEAVARLAAALDYAVIRCVAGSEISELQTPAGATVLALEELGAFLSREAGGVTSLSAIVASQGHYDEIALEALLEYPVGYVGVLASRKRMESIRGVLAQSGFAAERLAHVRNPIGLDIGARTPSEIALAILAEIVSLAQPAGWGEVDSASDGDARASASPSHRAESPHVHESVASHDRDATRAIDPVCGMSVEREGALHRFELGDRTVYFCCDGCKRSFAREPERFSVSLERT